MEKVSFDSLAQQLPLLVFNPELDSGFARSPVAQDYLTYYDINFTAEYPYLSHGFGCVFSGPYQVATHYFLKPNTKKVLYIVHGYYDHIGLYGDVIRAALNNDFSVVCFDLPGHGLSSGTPAVIDSFDEYTDALEQVVDSSAVLPFEKKYILGQSTGGSVVVDNLWRCREQKRPYFFEKSALLAPLVRPLGWKSLGWFYPLLQMMGKDLKRHFTQGSHDTEFLKFISTQDPLQAKILSLRWIGAMKAWLARVEAQEPIAADMLLLQGDEDKTLDWKFGLATLQEKVTTLDVEIIEGGHHHLVCESDEYQQPLFKKLFEHFHSSD